MRRFLLLLLTFAVVNASAPRMVLRAAEAADPSDLFLNAYMAVQQGEKLEHDGNTKQALVKYQFAAGLLDQISAKFPNWQKLIVEYRKKRTAENIARIQQRVAAEPGANRNVPNAPDTDPALPSRDEMPLMPSGGTSPMPPIITGPTAPGLNVPPVDEVDDAARQLRSRLDGLKSELKDANERAYRERVAKEELANRLDQALKQLDSVKVNDVELKSQLKQVQQAFQTATEDYNKDLESRKDLQGQVQRLKDALEEERADRVAAEQLNEDNARRLSKERVKTDSTSKELTAANQKADQLEARLKDAPKAVAQLEEARKQIAALTKDRDTVKQRAKELDGKLAEASKTAAQLEDAKKQIAALKDQNSTGSKANEELSAKLTEAQKQVVSLTKDRDAARQEVENLNVKVADTQQQIVAVSAERDQIAKQRDQALADLAQAREAQKQADKLLADNTALMEKLATAEKTIQQFNTDMPKKDEEIANLKKEMGDTRALLADTQRQNAEFQTTMNDLQQQLDKASSELAEVSVSGVSPEEKRKFTEENDLLRGIVLRQLKEQARRSQAKKLVLTELAKLEVQSDTLIKQIDYLGQPVVKLTDQEKALFKEPQIEISDTDAMQFEIAAPKPDSAGSSPAAGSSTPTGKSAGENTNPQPGANPATAPTAGQGAPKSATGPTAPGGFSEPELPKSDSAPSAKAEGNTSAAPQVETVSTPTVPQEMMGDARSAKELFERGQYRDAERTYEKMLAKAPNNIYILSNLGVVRFREQKLKLAEEAFKKAIAIAPQDSFSHCTLGIVYYQQGKYDDAITALTKAIAVNPKYAVAHNYLGITASQKGWQEAALKELETAIALDPNYADACFNIAVIYATQNPPNKELARKYYKRATELGAEPDNALEQMIK